jgi:hypothetical protein
MLFWLGWAFMEGQMIRRDKRWETNIKKELKITVMEGKGAVC